MTFRRMIDREASTEGGPFGNGAGQTRQLHVEESKEIHTYHLHKTQLQICQRPQYKTRFREYVRRESGEKS